MCDLFTNVFVSVDGITLLQNACNKYCYVFVGLHGYGRGYRAASWAFVKYGDTGPWILLLDQLCSSANTKSGAGGSHAEQQNCHDRYNLQFIIQATLV